MTHNLLLMTKIKNLYERVQEAIKGFTGDTHQVATQEKTNAEAIPLAILTEKEKKLYTLSKLYDHVKSEKGKEILDLMWESVQSRHPEIAQCENLELRPGHAVFGVMRTKTVTKQQKATPYDDSGRCLAQL